MLDKQEISGTGVLPYVHIVKKITVRMDKVPHFCD